MGLPRPLPLSSCPFGLCWCDRPSDDKFLTWLLPPIQGPLQEAMQGLSQLTSNTISAGRVAQCFLRVPLTCCKGSLEWLISILSSPIQTKDLETIQEKVSNANESMFRRRRLQCPYRVVLHASCQKEHHKAPDGDIELVLQASLTNLVRRLRLITSWSMAPTNEGNQWGGTPLWMFWSLATKSKSAIWLAMSSELTS